MMFQILQMFYDKPVKRSLKIEICEEILNYALLQYLRLEVVTIFTFYAF